MQSSFTKDPPGALNDNADSPQQEYRDTQKMVRMDSVVAVGRGKIVQITRHWPEKLSGDTALTGRALTHLTMIVVAIMVIVLSNLELSWGTISAIRPLKRATAKPIVEAVTEESGAPLTLPDELNDTRNGVLVRGAVPRIIIPEQTQAEQSKKEEIQIYVVQPGDTISGIATKFGLAPETIIWSNTAQEKNPDLLSVGQELIILPVDGVYHQVGGGDTIEGIAATYKADPDAIINHPLNKLDPENLIIQPGQWLIVPAGNKPFIPRTVAAYSGPVPEGATVGSGIFGWPASGSITQGYYGYHPGIDIGGWQGAPVIAADSGYVVAVGWDNTGYGNIVVIDHGNGFQTLYAHLHASYMEPGIDVAKGQQIGEMGSTGNATGPHLHFEIRQGTVQRNPYGFLP